MPQNPPAIGADVSSLMPGVGEDVSHLMDAPAQPADDHVGLFSKALAVAGVPFHALEEFQAGARKGAATTAVELGRLMTKIPGITDAIDKAYALTGHQVDTKAAFAGDTAGALGLTPSNPTQQVGKAAEQIGEFFVPGGVAENAATAMAGKLAPQFRNAPRLVQAGAKLAPRMATEAAAAAGVATAQGGNPVAAGVTGATGPVVGKAVEAAVPALKSAAEAGVVKALGPTKERFKAMAERLAPEMLKRGLRGSRESLAATAAAKVDEAGQAIDTALQAFGSQTAGVQPIVAALETSKDTFRSLNPQTGQMVVFEPRAVKQLEGLQRVVTDLGPDARIDQLVALRRTWDKVVADAGGYAHRAPGGIGVPLKDISEAANKREATTAIRQLLNTEVPQLSALNKEYSFWKNLDDVLVQTLKRTQPHGASLTGTIKEAAGQAVGSAATGGNLGAAFALGKMAKMANSVFASPRWKLASAQAKDALALAIANNNPGQIATALSRIGAGSTAQVTR